MSIIIKAPAKLNIGLKILAKRADGYYNIQTIMVPIDFFDEIELQKIDKGIEFISSAPPYGEENLCYKAAKLFLDEVKKKGGVKIKLKKNIWIGAGLGGGSSCAAKTLIGINKLFNNVFGYEKLKTIASKIGSDVTFFLKDEPAIVEGKGDIINYLPKLEMNFILVYPNISISTKWAYSKIKGYLTKENNFDIIKTTYMNKDIKKLAENLFNEFELLVFDKYKEIKEIKEKIMKEDILGASLTGSGSCIYAIIEKYKIYELNKRIKELFPTYKVKVVECI